jgi:sec-independent protein translocase protein TatB
MPGFGDSAVLILLALLLFGPKKLPQLARQLGKLMADFRRASNEFRTQMEEELRISEQADRQKQIAAIEAAAPPAGVLDTPPASDYPHEPPPAPSFASTSESTYDYPVDSPVESQPEPVAAPVPIATSGELSIMPPPTGLPTPNSAPATAADEHPAGHTNAPAHESELETETLHG